MKSDQLKTYSETARTAEARTRVTLLEKLVDFWCV